VLLIHATLGAAAPAIDADADADAGPCHPSLVNAVSSDPYDAAVECNSAASPFHADAVANIGLEPAPEYIRAELTSAGNTAISSIAVMVTSPRSGM
jgi:hypothetical protein